MNFGVRTGTQDKITTAGYAHSNTAADNVTIEWGDWIYKADPPGLFTEL